MKTLIPTDTAKLRAARALTFLNKAKLPRDKFTESHMLHVVAISLGFPDWNTMKAAIDKQPLTLPGQIERLTSYYLAELEAMSLWDGEGLKIDFRSPSVTLGHRNKSDFIMGEYQGMPHKATLGGDTLIAGNRKSALVEAISAYVCDMYTEGLPVIWVTDRLSPETIEQEIAAWSAGSQLSYEIVSMAQNLGWNMLRSGALPTLLVLHVPMLKNEQRSQLLPLVSDLMTARGDHLRAHLVLDIGNLKPADVVDRFFKQMPGRRWSLWARFAPVSTFSVDLRKRFGLRLVAGLLPDSPFDPSIDELAPPHERAHHQLDCSMAVAYHGSSNMRFAPPAGMRKPTPVHAQVGMGWRNRGADSEGKKAKA